MGDGLCGLCDRTRPIHASICLRVGPKMLEVFACSECFESATRKQTAFSMMIKNFLPEAWRDLIYGKDSILS